MQKKWENILTADHSSNHLILLNSSLQAQNELLINAQSRLKDLIKVEFYEGTRKKCSNISSINITKENVHKALNSHVVEEKIIRLQKEKILLPQQAAEIQNSLPGLKKQVAQKFVTPLITQHLIGAKNFIKTPVLPNDSISMLQEKRNFLQSTHEDMHALAKLITKHKQILFNTDDAANTALLEIETIATHLHAKLILIRAKISEITVTNQIGPKKYLFLKKAQKKLQSLFRQTEQIETKTKKELGSRYINNIKKRVKTQLEKVKKEREKKSGKHFFSSLFSGFITSIFSFFSSIGIDENKKKARKRNRN